MFLDSVLSNRHQYVYAGHMTCHTAHILLYFTIYLNITIFTDPQCALDLICIQYYEIDINSTPATTMKLFYFKYL